MSSTWYKIENRKPNKAELFIYGFIGESFFEESVSAKSMLAQLKKIDPNADLEVRINSGGGSVWDGHAIYNLLKNHKGKVTVYVDALAASIASVIAMAGDEIVIAKNAMMMIHDPHTLAAGDGDDMRKAAEMLDKVKDTIINVYQEKTQTSRTVLAKLMDAETWMTADEAVEMKFADRTTDPLPIAASLETSLAERFANLPEGFASLENSAIMGTEAEGVDPVSKEAKGESTDMPNEMTSEQIKAHIEEFMKAQAEELKKQSQADIESSSQKVLAKLIEKDKEKAESILNVLVKEGKMTPADAKNHKTLVNAMIDGEQKVTVGEGDAAESRPAADVYLETLQASLKTTGTLVEAMATSISPLKSKKAEEDALVNSFEFDEASVEEGQIPESVLLDQFTREVIMAQNEKLKYTEAVFIAEQHPKYKELKKDL